MIVWTLMVLTWMLGLVAFLVFPVLFGGLLPGRVQQALGNFYIGLATTAGDRLAVVIRENGGLELQPMRFDVDKSAEEISINGEDEHVGDDLGLVGWLNNKQFGIVDEKSSTFTDCLWAEIGERFRRHRERNHLQRVVASDGGDGAPRVQFSDLIPLDEQPQLTWPGEVASVLAGNRTAKDAEIAYEQGVKSQEKFGRSVSLGQSLTIGIMFAIGAAMIWFVIKYGGVAGGAVDSVTVPVTVGVGA
jgi:hypothetical protein